MNKILLKIVFTFLSVLLIFSSNSQIIINEINYNSADDFDTKDWVELFNNNTGTVDISGWVFKDANDENGFVIPSGTTMSSDSYLVIVRNKSAFEILFPSVSPVFGDMDFKFSNGGEQLRLFDDGGTLIDEVTYDDEDPWPTEPDGNGPTLELTDPDSDNNTASNWKASNAAHGTPSALNSTDSSVYEDNESNSISINPNPMRDESVFKIPGNTAITNGKLYIYNILGKELRQEIINSNETIIRKENLTTGIYICNFFNNNEFISSLKFTIK